VDHKKLAVADGRLTVADIVARLELERDRASASRALLWEKLVDLAGRLDHEQPETELTRHRWRLLNCSISNFRGVSGDLSVDFKSEADVTVFHGENGSGKSSLTAAIRMALEGAVGLTHAGAPIKSAKALWVSGDDRHRGALDSVVEVRLSAVDDPATELLIIADYNGANVRRSATVTSSGHEPVLFASDDPAWSSWDAAVRAAPPVFAYAELADELKARGDLQAWITKCLAMDVASRDFDGEVAGAVSSSGEAVRRVEESIDVTRDAFQQLDTKAIADGLSLDLEVDWPGVWTAPTLDEWRIENGLDDRASGSVALPSDLVNKFDDLVEEFHRHRRGWVAAASKLITPMVGQGLVRLSEAFEHSDHDGDGDGDGVCPVCGQDAPNWRARLNQRAAEFAGAQDAWRAIKLKARSSETDILEPVARSLRSHRGEESQDAYTGTSLVAACERLLAISRGEEADFELMNATEALEVSWSPEARDLLTRLVAQSDRRALWQAERVSAARPLFAIIDQDLFEAKSHSEWKSARVLWNPLLKSLRDARVARLEDQFAHNLREMLADVGFNLARLNVKKNETDIDIVDAAGQRVELSYLSAGQRNALILAPVLAQSGLGIFDFILIDDPVHAFDEFRVDKLAATLVRLGSASPLIITTHDGRFVEYLRAHLPERYAVVRVKRGRDGAITLLDSEAPWTVLFEQAGTLLQGAPSLSPTAARDICTLLRMGFDAALESFVHRALGSRTAEERAGILLSFESAPTSAIRMETARGIAGPQFDVATGGVENYLEIWSTGVHTDAPVDIDLAEHLRLARRTTKALSKL